MRCHFARESVTVIKVESIEQVLVASVVGLNLLLREDISLECAVQPDDMDRLLLFLL